ncbi:helix-turn-helix transcriptional regulator [Streptomyces sp. AB3(2024)]
MSPRSLAEEHHISSRYLHKPFRAECGQSPRQWRRSARARRSPGRS